MAVAAPISMFFQLQLRGVQATDARRSYEFSDYLTLRVLTTIAALFVSFIVIGMSHLSRSALVVVVLIALAKAVDSLSDVFYGAQTARRTEWI
ncbi:MAG: hypothetical protein R2855_11980 [Thermomicrobiales bacterium]